MRQLVRSILGSVRRTLFCVILSFVSAVVAAYRAILLIEDLKLSTADHMRRISIFGIRVHERRYVRRPLRVALLVDEFFGGWNTAIGGYGALARKYICRYVPNDEIAIDVILGLSRGPFVRRMTVDGTRLYRLPRHRMLRQAWLDKQSYDLFLSIELTGPSFQVIGVYESKTPLLYWIQDPRDLALYQPRRRAVTKITESDWEYVNGVARWLQREIGRGRVRFISQGNSLSCIARGMFAIPKDVQILRLANPVEIDWHYDLRLCEKTDKIVFLGRLEAQKRAWVACEVAKAMPQYQFYIIGATGRNRREEDNARTLAAYRNADGSSRISNLHFVGHVDGEAKNAHLRSAKVLLNTSFWEGIPISWLEAMSYGAVIVSAFDRDNIVSRFGTFVGEIAGDATDTESIHAFATAIEYWLQHDALYRATAIKAIEYVRANHSIEEFVAAMRGEIIACSRGLASA